MMMLAGGEAQSAAKATKIVNTLANLKIFTLSWYKNNIDKIDKDGKFHKNGDLTGEGQTLQDYFATSAGQAELKKALTSDLLISNSEGGYEILNDTNKDNKEAAWYACYHLPNNSERASIREKLADKAEIAQKSLHSQDLLQRKGKNWEKYKSENTVYMQILVFNYNS